MHEEQKFNYLVSDKGFKALAMPYVGEELSMIIFLPDKADGIKDFEKLLNTENITKWLNLLSDKKTITEVLVSMPKFKLTCGYLLSDVLSAMGMPDAFSQNADFSGMTNDKGWFISNVIHKAFVDVNEEGTEAAAATGATLCLKEKSINFDINHPFIFLIYDIKSNNILFMGRMMNPK